MDSCLKKYCDGLSPNSVYGRSQVVLRFFKFCGVSPSEGVAFQRMVSSRVVAFDDGLFSRVKSALENKIDVGVPVEYWFLEAVYVWLKGLALRVSSKNQMLSNVRGFFLANRCPLPKDRHRFHSDREPVVGELKLDEFRKILVASRLDYRCAFLMMYQSGSGAGELCYMNQVHSRFIFDEVKRGADVIVLNMPGRKKKRNVEPYYTIIGGDAIDCLRQLFHSRGWRRDVVLFRTEKGEPFSGGSLHRYLKSVAFRLGFLKAYTPCCLECGGETVKRRVRRGGADRLGYVCVVCHKMCWSSEYDLSRSRLSSVRYRIHTHEIRDLFRTEFHRASVYTGADSQLAEFMMGHTVDALGYNKIMKDRKYAVGEYRKVSPFLNILSENPRVVDRVDVESKLEAAHAESRAVSEKLAVLEREVAAGKRFFELVSDPEVVALLKRLAKKKKG